MKYSDWKATQGLTDEGVRQLLRNNLLTGKGMVAIYVCPKCDEILDDYVEHFKKGNCK